MFQSMWKLFSLAQHLFHFNRNFSDRLADIVFHRYDIQISPEIGIIRILGIIENAGLGYQFFPVVFGNVDGIYAARSHFEPQVGAGSTEEDDGASS
jgi:hypothetical protein